MFRSPSGALTAVLALIFTALVMPAGSAAPPVEAASATAVASAPLAVQYGARTPACRAGLIALTFDDGPSPSVTPGLVNTLVRVNVPATFFMLGSRVRAEPALARRVQRAGFLIANHSWSHPPLTNRSTREVKRELVRTRQEFLQQRIVAGDLMRPPYGDANARVRKAIRSLGMTEVLWSNDSFDWKGGGPRAIAGRVMAKLNRNGTNVVLQHDGVSNSPNSVKAVPLIVNRARKLGYCFVELASNGRPAVPVPTLRTSVLSGTEDGAAPVRLRLDLDRATTRAVSLRVHAVSGSAQAGTDFVPGSRQVVFPRGSRTAWVTVPVLNDRQDEGVEDLRLVLDSPRGLTIPHRVLPASIFSDD